MGVNKVIYYGEVLVDMSQVTVTPESLEKGKTALDAKGELITGLHECEETEPNLQEKTVTPTTALQTVNPDSGYDGLSKVTVNAMPTATQATPSISVSSAGKITASSTQTAGYVAAGTKSATKQLTTQAAKTVTPTTSSQTAVASGRYTTGAVTVAGDANLVPANIVSGKSIFGVAGSATTGEDLTSEITEYAELNNELESIIDGLPSAGGSGGSVEFGYFMVHSWDDPSGNETYKIPFMIGQTWGDWVDTTLNARVFVNAIGMVQLSESNGKIIGMASSGMNGSLSTSSAANTTVSLTDSIQNEATYYIVMSGSGSGPNPYE